MTIKGGQTFNYGGLVKLFVHVCLVVDWIGV